jgi:protein O-mannosyl-transferase
MLKDSRKKKTSTTHIAVIPENLSESLITSVEMSNRQKTVIIIHVLLIVLVGLIAYSNIFSVPFYFDDMHNIVENPVVKDFQYFIEPSKARVFEIYNAFKSRFIGYLSFALNYQLHGLDVSGYHTINLTIHILNALLVYWLVVLTFKTLSFRAPDSERNSELIALFSGLLFVSHPIQTQAVTYIVQRFTSLATMFYLLSLVMYIKARQGNQNTENRSQNIDKRQKIINRNFVLCYLTSAISAVLAMKTKEIAFTLPIIITLYEFMFFEGKIKKRILYLTPILLTILIIPLSLIRIDKSIGDIISDAGAATRVQTEMSRWVYLFTQLRVLVTYIRLLFLPINQNLDYDYPIYNSFIDPNVLISFFLLLSIFALGVYSLYRSEGTDTDTRYALRLTSFGIFWFFITLSVESSVIVIVDVIFEHRVYLPSVGAFIALLASFFFLLNNLKHKWPIASKICITALILLIIMFIGVTYTRNTTWQSSVKLWTDVIMKSPKKARPYNELGLAYLDNGEPLKAVSCFERALTINPSSFLLYSNLGNAFDELGYIDHALIQYQKAIEINPKFETAHYNVGIIYYKKKMFKEAIAEFNIAVSLNPFNYDAKKNLEILYEMNLTGAFQ